MSDNIENVMAGQDRNRLHVKKLANAMLVPVRRYQQFIGLQNATPEHMRNILDAFAWDTALMLARLPRPEFRRERDYFMSRFEESVAAIRSAPAKVWMPEEG